MSGKAHKHNMPETMYRASRCCRILGNPTAYLLLKSLGTSRKTPTDLSKECRVSIQTVSRILKDLRLIEAVRYETAAGSKMYWIKDQEILSILDSLETWVERERMRKS